ncbi:MAG TPA: cupin domain-containing protein [Candidatus Limnocylindrales bacterium]|jgi:quercetin dioxygenase-like cupin family protein
MSRFVIGQADGDVMALVGGIGVQFKVEGEWTGGAVSIVEHPVPAGAFALPHTHSKEDEISYVLDGTLGAEIDGEEMTIQAGQYLLKPRGLKHAFWNPTDKPARIIEVIAPAGLERFFRTMGTLRPVPGTEDFDTAMALVAERGVETHFDEREAFLARHGLQAPAMSIAHG